MVKTPKPVSPGPATGLARSSLGVQHNSERPSSAMYGFGTARRDDAAKVFLSRQHAKATSGGSSPGPAHGGNRSYSLVDGLPGFSAPPRFSFGTGCGVKTAAADDGLPHQDGPGPDAYRPPPGGNATSRLAAQPAYGFGTSTRSQSAKLYVSNHHASASGMGATDSPGPAYTIPSGIGRQVSTRGKSASAWGFGTAKRFDGPGVMGTNPLTPGPGAYNPV